VAPVGGPDVVELENLDVRRRCRQDIVLLDVGVVDEDEEAVAEEVVEVFDLGDVVAVEKVEVFKEGAVVGDLDAADVFPEFAAGVGSGLVAFEDVVNFHEAVAVVEVVVEVDEHVAAGDVLAVFEFDGDKHCAEECDGEREDADGSLFAGPEPGYDRQTQQNEQYRGEDDEKLDFVVVSESGHGIDLSLISTKLVIFFNISSGILTIIYLLLISYEEGLGKIIIQVLIFP